MTFLVESTSTRILVHITDERGPFILQRAFYKDRTWKTYTNNGFVIIPESELFPTPSLPPTQDEDVENEEVENEEVENEEVENEEVENEEVENEEVENEENLKIINTTEEKIKPLEINAGDFIDSFDLVDGLWEYRYIPISMGNSSGDNWVYSQWCKFGLPDAIGYSFGNYTPAHNEWGLIITPDDLRYTYLWGTDFKATNGSYFSDKQIEYFIEEALSYMERQLNITIKRKIIKSIDSTENLEDKNYDEEEALYDFNYRKIQRYGMVQTKKRPILKVSKFSLINRNSKQDLLPFITLDKKQGTIKFLKRPIIPSDTYRGISQAIGRYGSETFQTHLFYAIDYEAGFQTCMDVPKDLRQIIAKVVAISLLNIIGDGLMSGFSSSSLSMDGISESFSSTQSATSAYFGARIAVYQKEVENYIKENKYKFGTFPIGCL